MDIPQLTTDLAKRAIAGTASENDLDTVIAWPKEQIELLFDCTEKIRTHFFGNTVEPCAIMNIKSGACSEDCAFCSQSRHNRTEIPIQPLSEKEDILSHYRAARAQGLSFGVVSSGKRLSSRELENLAEVFRKCEGDVHASLGVLTDDEFEMLKRAGLVCYNHNLETNREFFPRIVSTHTFEERLETVRRAKKHGIRACCGGIFGLGESWQDRKSLCLELKALDVDVIPVNFLNPIPGTRVQAPKESPLEFLKIVSLFRIGHPDKVIKVCGGRELHLKDLQTKMFRAGANGFISGDYLTTKGDTVASDDRMLADLGLEKRGHT